MQQPPGLLAMAIASVLALIGAHCAHAVTWPQGLPVYDHIVIVIEENKDYEQIIGSPNAPFVNQIASDGAILTRMFGEEHNSQGNYFWLFCADRFDLGFRDEMPAHDFTASNLAQRLREVNRSFKGYSEDLPQIGSRVELSPKPPCGGNCGYARKHVPWVSFPDLCKAATSEACVNLPFSEFTKLGGDYSRLPTVSIVIPNLVHDMHSVESTEALAHSEQIAREVAQGDRWLGENLRAYYEWARTHNSLLIVTFDESDNFPGVPPGLTDPASGDRPARNRIATLFAGDRIQRGSYDEGNGATHVNILRTIEAMYGLQKSGAQQAKARAAGISDDFVITDIFTSAPSQH